MACSRSCSWTCAPASSPWSACIHCLVWPLKSYIQIHLVVEVWHKYEPWSCEDGRQTHRTVILRVESTIGLNRASSTLAGLFGALLAEVRVRLGFSSAVLLSTGTGLNREALMIFCRRNAAQFIKLIALQVVRNAEYAVVSKQLNLSNNVLNIENKTTFNIQISNRPH